MEKKKFFSVCTCMQKLLQKMQQTAFSSLHIFLCLQLNVQKNDSVALRIILFRLNLRKDFGVTVS